MSIAEKLFLVQAVLTGISNGVLIWLCFERDRMLTRIRNLETSI